MGEEKNPVWSRSCVEEAVAEEKKRGGGGDCERCGLQQ